MKLLKAAPDKFYMVYPEPELVNVCFWYIPERLRCMPHGPERMQQLGKVSPEEERRRLMRATLQVTAQLKSRMMKAGTMMISYQPLGSIPNFFRNIVSNPGAQHKDMDFLVAELDRLGHDL